MDRNELYLKVARGEIGTKESGEELLKIQKQEAADRIKLAEKPAEELSEGFFDKITAAFAQGMKDELKKSIDPKWHKIYGIDKVTNVKQAKDILVKAKKDGNLIA